MIKAELNEAERARQNRELVKTGIGNRFYDRQSKIAAQWESGALPPKGLVVSEDSTFRHSPVYPFAGGRGSNDED